MLRIKRGDFCDMVSVVLGINKSSVSVSHSCCCCLRKSRGTHFSVWKSGPYGVSVSVTWSHSSFSCEIVSWTDFNNLWVVRFLKVQIRLCPWLPIVPKIK